MNYKFINFKQLEEVLNRQYVTCSGKRRRKSPVIKLKKLAKTSIRCKFFTHQFLAFINNWDLILYGKNIIVIIFHLFHDKFTHKPCDLSRVCIKIINFAWLFLELYFRVEKIKQFISLEPIKIE